MYIELNYLEGGAMLKHVNRMKIKGKSYKDVSSGFMSELLAFQRQDLERLTDAGRERLYERLKIPVTVPNEGVFKAWPKIADPLDGHYSLNALKDFQQQIRNAFNQLVPKDSNQMGKWELPVSIKKITLYREMDHKKQPIFRPHYTVSSSAFYWIMFAELLETHAPYLERCQECKAIFLRTKRQEYCSKKCSQRARTRRFYKEHRSTILKQRRLAYQERLNEAKAQED
jgi:hypothetical protein